MPKAIFAITNIKVGTGTDEVFVAGSVVNKDKFTKPQLLELLDAGAIEIRVVEAEAEAEAEPASVVTPDGNADEVPNVDADEASDGNADDSTNNGESDN